MRHHYLNIAALCIALTVTLGHPNHLWAQKGVGDITLAPGASASLYFKVYCIEFGMPLTKEPLSFKGRSEHDIADILHYAHWKGYVETDPVQVQLAIWKRKTGDWKAANHAIAEDILNNASQSPAEANQGGVFLMDAVKAGSVRVVETDFDIVDVPGSPVSWPWLGEGHLTVTNTSNQSMMIVVRDGFELAAPHDHMTGYVTSHRVHD